MNNIPVKKLNKRGFTVAETLLAIGVVAILLAVTVPLLAVFQQRLEMRRLDDTARQIYLAVQNRMTTMKATGELITFENRTALPEAALTAAPADYAEKDDTWQALYTVASTDAVCGEYLLAEDSVLAGSVADGTFLLELNPASGDVYSVFYAERDFGRDTITRLDETFLSREQAVRQDVDGIALGYYCGSASQSAAAALPDQFQLTAHVVNKEDLYVTFGCDGIRGEVFRNLGRLTLTVTLRDEQQATAVRSISGTQFTTQVVTGTASVAVLLDSIDQAAAYQDFDGVDALHPGDDLTVDAAIVYQNGDTRIEGTLSGLRVNSCFAKKTETAEGLTVEIAALRHLNNLRYFNENGRFAAVQTADVTFDAAQWDRDARLAAVGTENPLSTFQPIANTSLAAYDGGEHLIAQLPISGIQQVGLFQWFSGTLENIRLEDCSVQAEKDTAGAIVGLLEGGTVTNCGAYLSDGHADMAVRKERYAVRAASDAGGLAGAVTGDVTLTHSFSAMDVTGADATRLGGLIGSATAAVTIDGCYASGDVTGHSRLGGLVGYTGQACTVRDSYVTSDMDGDSMAGGFVGKTGASVTARDSFFYGEIQTPGMESGPFVGNGSADCAGCRYLTQGAYNAFSVPGGSSFAALRAATANAASMAHPYDSSLYLNAFPFPMIRWTEQEETRLLDHYGDWPPELQLQTTLAYYEKYVDGTYGYYAETTLVNGEGGAAEGKSNDWVVNTLQQKLCQEDGYVLLCVYPLTEYRYTLNRDLYPGTEAVTVTVNDSTDKLLDNVSLTFTRTTETGESANYTISNAKAYRLPIALQMTRRNNAARFYDQLQISDGMVGTAPVFEGNTYTFYYCPDFAQNAINPDLSAGSAVCPPDPNTEHHIFVRSARQLNAMGRASYYWNPGNNTSGKGNQFYFEQTNDIDFARYTKTYCGVKVDLMDTDSDNTYRNVPIGRPAGQSFTRPGSSETYTPAQFMNIYDGGGYEIVDYCCTTYMEDGSGYQFTGMFGEIKSAVIQNVVLRASDPEAESGAVRSNYADGSHHPGVGALVGLMYVDRGEVDSTYPRIQNCAVSGYTVAYGGKTRNPAAVGGMVGYTFGEISNCMVTNTTVESNVQGTRYLGGITGSLNGRGSIQNCYTELTSRFSGTARNSKVGGIAGGFDNIYGYGDNASGDRAQRITDCYTYTAWSSDMLQAASAFAIAPTGDKLRLSGCRYVTDTVDDDVSLSGGTGVSGITAKALAGLKPDGFGKADASHSYPYSGSLVGQAYPFPAVVSMEGGYRHYGDWPQAAQSGKPRIVYYERYTDGTVGCCGAGNGTGAAYNTLDTENDKTIQSTGYGILCQSGAFTIATAEHGVSFDGNTVLSDWNQVDDDVDGDTLYACSDALMRSIQTTTGWTAAAYSKLTLTEGGVSRDYWIAPWYVGIETTQPSGADVQIRTAEQLQALNRYNQETIARFHQTHDIALTDGFAGISGYWRWIYDGMGNAINGLTVPLFSSGSGTLQNIRLMQVKISGTGDQIAAPLAGSFQGTVENCLATGSVRGAGAAGLVGVNAGTIRSCYANCAVTAVSGNGAGLVLSSSGSGAIENCYAVGTVSAAKDAAGLVHTSWNPVRSCYAAVALSGEDEYGFGRNGRAYNGCYWLQQRAFNQDAISANGAMKCSVRELRALDGELGAEWTMDNDGHTHPDTQSGSYPYPRLTALDHYGDWPQIKPGGQTGIYQLYRHNQKERWQIVGISNDPANWGTATHYELEDSSCKPQQTYGLLFDDEFDPLDWTIRYTYSYQYYYVSKWGSWFNEWRTDTITGTIAQLSALEDEETPYNLPEDSSLTLKKLPLNRRDSGNGNGYRSEKLTATLENDYGETYSFVYDGLSQQYTASKS